MDKLQHKKIPLKTLGFHFSAGWDIFQGVVVLTSRKLQHQLEKEKPLRCSVSCPRGWHRIHPLSVLQSFICPAFLSLLTVVPLRCRGRQMREGGRSVGRGANTAPLELIPKRGQHLFLVGQSGISFFFSLTLGWGSTTANGNLYLLGSNIYMKTLESFLYWWSGFSHVAAPEGLADLAQPAIHWEHPMGRDPPRLE